MNKKIKIIIVLVLTLILSIGGIYYMQKESQNPHLSEKETKLYKHGFQLLEEQIATYLKEHYTGISKIEFSPIFMSGGNGESFLRLSIVTRIYDEYGNNHILSGKIGGVYYETDAHPEAVLLDFDYSDNEIIYLKDSFGAEVDVSDDDSLPNQAKLTFHKGYEAMIPVLVEEGKLKGVKESSKGSPKVEIVYNLEVKKGEWEKWQ